MAWLIAVGLGLALGAWWGRNTAGRAPARARAEAAALLAQSRRVVEEARSEAALHAREEAAALRNQAMQSADRLARDLDRVRQRLAKRQAALAERQQLLTQRRTEIDARRRAMGQQDAATRALRDQCRGHEQRHEAALEQAAGMSTAAIRAEQRDAILEQARSDVAMRLHQSEADLLETSASEARRVMSIAAERYAGHYLTERSMFNVPLDPAQSERWIGPDGYRSTVEAATGTTLTVSEAGDAIRIEGPDGVAREGARRVMARLFKQPRPAAEVDALSKQVVADLEREIDSLGRRAFEQLRIPRAHAEIVRLVGRLNWRTSYTQNQWKHAVEAAQLASLVASELGMDGRLARRGALLHDIGKSLTPQMEGSHALIGAEIARRLGEAEVVANCIGAHHAEEPCNSAYAHLVAGTDAMSGGRPGARREAAMVESYGRRVEDMERLAGGFHGVERVYALQGGREVRVYVRETDVDDAGVARLSSEIARKISDEVVFPGQVKVTVIRQHRAVAMAR